MRGIQRTFAAPKFSIAGILCPVASQKRIDINAAQKSVVSAPFSEYAPRRSSSRSVSGLM